MRRRLFILILILCCGHASLAQDYYLIPRLFNQGFFTMAFQNPAEREMNDLKANVVFGNFSYVGAMKKVSTQAFNGALKLGQPNRQESFSHVLGGSFLTNNNGPLIQETWANLTYTGQLKLSEEYLLSGGIGVGVISMNNQGNTSTTNNSASAFDMNLGIVLYSKKMRAGFAINQITSPELRPIIATYTASSNYLAYGSYSFQLNPTYSLTPFVYYRIHSNGVRNELALQAIGAFKDLFQLGLGYHHEQGMMGYVGVKTKTRFTKATGIGMSYFAPFSNSPVIQIPSLELTLNVGI